MFKPIFKELGIFVLSLFSLIIPVLLIYILGEMGLLNWGISWWPYLILFAGILFFCVGLPFKRYKIFFRDILILSLSIFIFGVFVFLTM